MPSILMFCLGSRGDVVPYAAVGQALQACGHRVRLAAFENFRELVTGLGLDYAPIRGDSRAMLAGSGGLALGEAGQNILSQFRAIREAFTGLSGSLGPDMAAAAAGVHGGVDLIISQIPGALYTFDLAEHLGVPLVSVAIMPLARTRAWPHLSFPSRLGRLPGFNRISYTLAEQLIWLLFGTATNRWRRALGLRPHPPGGPFRRMAHQAGLVLNGFSERVVPRPADWPANVHVTGYWFPASPPDWQPPVGLLRFIEAGPPPVFLGFGSMTVRDGAGLSRLLLEAVRLSGGRAILHAGWSGLRGDGASLPPEIYPIDFAPYDWLFPRLAAVVHHGGGGTTSMALRGGTPSLVVPFVFDQFFWGERVAALGVGPALIPFATLTARRLAAGLTRMTTDTAMRRRAAALGQALAAEDGLAEATRLIEGAF